MRPNEEDTHLVLFNKPIARHLEYVESALKLIDDAQLFKKHKAEYLAENQTAMWLINDLRVFCLAHLRALTRIRRISAWTRRGN